MKKDFYETLGLSKGAGKADIKSAYRKMALKYHPDKNKSPDAEDKFKEINEAYEVLSNDDKKTAYDQYGHAAFEGGQAGPFGGNTYTRQQGPFNFTYTNTSDGNPFGSADFNFGGFSNPFDIFEQFFGTSFGQGARLPTHKITISFLEAANGVEKHVNLNGQRKTIKIPAGVADGQRIRFNEFILYIDVAPNNTFKRDDYDVFVNASINFKQATLGDKISVPTLDDGNLTVKIQPGTQSNTLIRLRGKGIRHLNSSRRGDFYIRVLVNIPTKLSHHQKQQIDQLDL